MLRNLDNPIDTRQLRAFVALAQCGGLKRAALEIMVTESAISHSIRNLEENLGVKLFQRTGKGLSLTDAGRILLKEAVPILVRMRDIRNRLGQSTDAFGGEIRFMVGTSFIRSALHDILMEFRHCFPKVEVKVTAGDRDSCIEALASGQADAGVLINLPHEQTDVHGVHLFTDELMLLMSSNHRLAEYNKVPLHALCREVVYMRREQNFTTRIIEQEIARWSFQLRNRHYIGSFEALGELVRLGMGVAFQSPWAFRRGQANPEFTWRKVEELYLRRHWCFAWSGHCVMDMRLSTLMRLCEKAGHRLTRDQCGLMGSSEIQSA